MRLRRTCAVILVNLGDALNTLALRCDPDAPTREWKTQIGKELDYIEYKLWLRRNREVAHEDEVPF